jgi:hypothetical protein
MNSNDIDIFANDPSTDDPSDLASESITDDFNIFQANLMLYSHLMS